ncbi:MAG: HD domain-containing protein [Gallionella sp.]|nr:HD domain-containing protein [Gallionella sp.]
MFDHQDVFSALNGKLPLPEKIDFIHGLLKDRFEFIDRVAVAIYEPKTDLLKTFVHSSGGDNPLSFYSARLADSASLQEILKTGRPRVVNDMEVFNRAPAEHSRRIATQKYGSSYTMPMLLNGEFFGFLFFNSYRKYAFNDGVLNYLDMVGHLLSLLVIHEISTARNLLATVKTATNMVLHRDFETGMHLDRMANYARLIAKEVAKKHQLNDDLIEHIFQFSPLHDVGKIGIPDSILLKPAKLTEAEFDMMKTHTVKGGEIIGLMLENLGLDDLHHAGILRNIALYHHEAIDGSGYGGLTDAQIPIEAKIVAVADVFDALTSKRIYKKVWSNDEAIEFLQSTVGSKFDRDCVAALISCRDEIEAIQAKFKDE